MSKLSTLIFGSRATGPNIINEKPTTTPTNAAGNISFGLWKNKLKVSSKAPELRTIRRGDNTLLLTNIKLNQYVGL
jgi:hypothetical protein